MSSRLSKLNLNSVWNTLGMVAHMATGFLVAPFLINKLGDTTYGLWIIIASLTGYFAVLDLGVLGSVGRNVSFCQARGDVSGINQIVNTALLYLGVVAIVSVGCVYIIACHISSFITIEVNQTSNTFISILLVGVSFAFQLPSQVFDGILWAYERFDIQNLVDVPVAIARAVLTWLFVTADNGLIALALITICCTVVSSLCKVMATILVYPHICYSIRYITRTAGINLFGYGIWYFLLSLSRTISPQLALAFVGERLGTAAVTPFSIATRLKGYVNSLLIAGTQVLTPTATRLHAQGDHLRLRTLFANGTRICLIATLLFCTLFLFLGRPFLQLWIGDHMVVAYDFLLILLAGEILPMSQWVSYSTILAQARHRVLAVCGLLELIVSSVGVLAGAQYGGLTLVCIAIAIPATLFRGVVPLLYGCSLISVSASSIVWRSLLCPLLRSLLPISLLAITTYVYHPATWAEVVGVSCGYAISYVYVFRDSLLTRERVDTISPVKEPL
jgi:O-antigen/teichoic acid export membrane protein